MDWQGKKLRDMLRDKGVTLVEIAEKLQVSRQAVNDWVNGTIPKGRHLLALSQFLGISPEGFFSPVTQDIVVPVHRKRRNAKLTESRQEQAIEMVKSYDGFYRNRSRVKLQRVIRFPADHEEKDLSDLPNKLRRLADARNYYPLQFQQIFRLFENLEIEVVFRRFPADLKSYAFFTEIYGYPVVFVNTSNNLLDLAFPMLHEAIHALCKKEQGGSAEFSEVEELLCDRLASQVLFTPEYIREVGESLKGLPTAQQVIKLKRFSKTHFHSMFGIVQCLNQNGFGVKVSVGGADTNIHKDFTTLEEVLFGEGSAARFVENLASFSPIFVKELKKRLPTISDPLLAEWLGLVSSLDAKEIRENLESISINNGK